MMFVLNDLRGLVINKGIKSNSATARGGKIKKIGVVEIMRVSIILKPAA